MRATLKKFNRAVRRHHRYRLRNNRKWYYTHYGLSIYNIDYIETARSFYVNTPKACSCWMCGNSRRQSWKLKEKLTIQELRYNLNYKYNIENINE
jgi:hypothetical protein